MGKTIMGAAAVSLDGFIADENDDVGPLFDWLGSGDVSWALPGSDRAARSSQASADFMTSHYGNMAANVIGGGCSTCPTAGTASRPRLLDRHRFELLVGTGRGACARGPSRSPRRRSRRRQGRHKR